MVGERGFEPPTPWSRTRCSTRLSHSPTSLRDLGSHIKKHNRELQNCSRSESIPLCDLVNSVYCQICSRAARGNYSQQVFRSFLENGLGCYNDWRTLNRSMDVVITASRLYTPLETVERPLVFVEDGVIVEIGSLERQQAPAAGRFVDFEDACLAPGFIDVHVHGGAGHDVMESDPEALGAMEQLLYRHGVTSYLPTTITAPVDETLRALERLACAIEGDRSSAKDGQGAKPVGIHIEGPFISHVRRGVHPPENILPPTLETFKRFWDAARGCIKVMTIAPELEGARAVIAEAAARGVCVSIGHSDADLKAARSGIAAGARHATHTFNAMRPLDHRDPGILGVVLTDERVSAEIIADGIHVDPVVIQLFLRAKGPDSAVLVTDGTAATGMPNGRYRLGSLEVDVQDGKCLAEGKLAGSVLTMDRAVQNVMKFANWDLQHAVRLATLNPARTAGILPNAGKLAPGAPADMVVLGENGDVHKTIVRGQIA
jgi:N-acetylglucosamine-6-phosphate deacetylase